MKENTIHFEKHSYTQCERNLQNQSTFYFVAPTKIWGTLHLLSPMEYTHGFALMAELPEADQGKRPEPLAMEFEKENEKLSFSL